MATRKALLALFASLICTLTIQTRAEDLQPKVDNAKFQFTGQINAPAVPVYSGPSNNYYITSKLDKGAPVTVVGIKFDWLKIVPPEGSFSVIAKNLVTKEADGKTGRINGDNVNVRAGSSLVPVKITVQCKLQKGDVVEIKDEDDAYYHIKPPPEAYLYVQQKFVDPVKQINAPQVAENTKAPERLDPPAPKKIETAKADEKVELIDGNASANRNVIELKPAPTTQPLAAVPVAVEAEFDRLEAQFAGLAGKPLDAAPIPELLAGYEGLLKNDHLPASMRRVAQAKAAALRIKAQARTELLALRKADDETSAKLAALAAEREQLKQKLADGVIAYTAVGLLQPSTLQNGSQTLYRLVDPANGRTLCYVRSNNARFGTFLEKFVGIKGELVSESTLTVKALIATDVAAVDPADISRKISAQIIPPSILAPRNAAPARAEVGTGVIQ